MILVLGNVCHCRAWYEFQPFGYCLSVSRLDMYALKKQKQKQKTTTTTKMILILIRPYFCKKNEIFF